MNAFIEYFANFSGYKAHIYYTFASCKIIPGMGYHPFQPPASLRHRSPIAITQDLDPNELYLLSDAIGFAANSCSNMCSMADTIMICCSVNKISSE